VVQWIYVGFYKQEEQETDGKKNGVWKNTPHERRYFARTENAVQRNYSEEGSLNQRRGLNMDLSIIVDPWLISHMQDIMYVKVLGSKWQIQSIEPHHPRYTLHVGELFKEEPSYVPGGDG
jgi:hypothetical protein